VQHHIAHVLSCMAENEIEPPLLGVSWDGTGYGLDGSIWGGEFFVVTQTTCERVAHLRPFACPAATRRKRAAPHCAGLLYEMFGDAALGMNELAPLQAFPPVELAPSGPCSPAASTHP